MAALTPGSSEVYKWLSSISPPGLDLECMAPEFESRGFQNNSKENRESAGTTADPSTQSRPESYLQRKSVEMTQNVTVLELG